MARVTTRRPLAGRSAQSDQMMWRGTRFSAAARNAYAHARSKGVKRSLKYSIKLLATRPSTFPVSPHLAKNFASRSLALSSVCVGQ